MTIFSVVVVVFIYMDIFLICIVRDSELISSCTRLSHATAIFVQRNLIRTMAKIHLHYIYILTDRLFLLIIMYCSIAIVHTFASGESFSSSLSEMH